MASYRGHLALAAPLGVAYGGFLAYHFQLDWASSVVAAGLTTLGGFLPDLDSDSGKPQREMFGFAAAVMPVTVVPHLVRYGLTPEQIILVAAGLYFLIRHGLSALFRKITVHRGMFHSVPALLICGMATFLIYQHPSLIVRLLMASGAMIGFLSHLVLDEIYSVDLSGATFKLNKYAGSALKFSSPSQLGTATCYLVLIVLGYFTLQQIPALQRFRAEENGRSEPPASLTKAEERRTVYPVPPSLRYE